MTNKKDFKEQCSFHEYGRGKNKRNAIYFDWKTDTTNNAVGFKYLVKGRVEDLPKKELFDVLYNWVINEIQPPWYVEYRFALTEDKRFKVALMG